MGHGKLVDDPVSVETVNAWQSGDETAIHAIFSVYYPRAVRLAALSGMSLDEAQDCAQEAFVQAFERRGQLRDPQAFSLWFHRIATRRILDTIGHASRRHEVALDHATDLSEDWQRHHTPQPDEVVILAEQRQTLWESIQALPPRPRLALALRYYENFSLRDIATMLDMREGALRVTVHRALAQLRPRVREEAPPEPLASRTQ